MKNIGEKTANFFEIKPEEDSDEGTIESGNSIYEQDVNEDCLTDTGKRKINKIIIYRHNYILHFFS